MNDTISTKVETSQQVKLSMAKSNAPDHGYMLVYTLDKDEAIAWRDALNEAFPPEEGPDD